MKPRYSNRQNHALTLVDVLVVIFVFAVLMAILLSALPRKHDWRRGLNCEFNLRQVGVAFRIWEGDHNDKYPMGASITNGGMMELAATGNAAAIFQVMSNELSTPKIVLCPQDLSRDYATNFTSDFTKNRISYFVGLDATESDPQSILSGDDNFEIGGVPVKPGLLEISSNTPIAWSAARHKFSGYLLMADGSVGRFGNSMLTNRPCQLGSATNRLAIP